jgi:hypothetical protein
MSTNRTVTGILACAVLVCVASNLYGAVKKRGSESVLDTPQAHYQQAMRMLDAGDFEDALKEFQQTISLDPDHAGAYVGFALLRARQGEFEDAMRYVKTARRKAKRWVDVYLARGRVQVMEGKKNWLKDARKSYSEARKLSDQDDRVPFYEGEAYRQAGDYDSAEQAFREAVGLNGPTQARAERAFRQMQLVKQAEPFTEAGLRIARMDPLTRADLCVLLIDEMKLEELVEKHVDSEYDTAFRSPGGEQPDSELVPPSDVSDSWAQAWISRVLALKVPGLGVLPDGSFRPAAPVTRKDMAMVIQGLLVLIKRDPSLTTKFLGAASQFKDVRADVYYFNAATLVVSKGLMSVDKLEGTFAPDGEVSGVEAVLALKDLKDGLVRR